MKTRPKRLRKPAQHYGDVVDINSASKFKFNISLMRANGVSPKNNSKKKNMSTRQSLKRLSSKKVKKIESKKKINNAKQALDEALIRLHSSSSPESLPCREYQFEDIYNFCSRKLIEGEGGCMYISGVPGTGKTATLREVKQKLCQNSDLPSFKFIEINGLKLGEPKQFFSHFLLELDGIKKSTKLAANILTERFTTTITNTNKNKNEKEFIILFIDELDYLKTKKQEILYQIFDWPTYPNSRLIVLAIANSMDLPEKLLLNRVSSRLGLTRLLFQPYSHEELRTIVTSRLSDLNGFDIFEPDALELICRKVSAVSGDARRVLDICRRALEIAINDNNDKVNMQSVDKTLKEIFNSIKMNRITKSSQQEKIFLKAFLQNFRRSGLEVFQFIEIYQTHVDICRLENLLIPTTTELSMVANNLDLSKIILLEKSHSQLYRRVRLNVSPDDIDFGLNLN